MKHVILLLLLLVSVPSFGQKCNYLANSVSGLDGSRLVITDPAALSKEFADGKLEVYSSLYADSAIMLSFIIISDTEVILDENDRIVLNLEKGNDVALSVYKQPVLSTSPAQKLTCNVLLSKEQEALLLSSVIQSVSFTGQDIYTVAITKKKEQRAIAEKILCILSIR